MERNLYDELKEGFESLKKERQGKVILIEHSIEVAERLHITKTRFALLK